MSWERVRGVEVARSDLGGVTDTAIQWAAGLPGVRHGRLPHPELHPRGGPGGDHDRRGAAHLQVVLRRCARAHMHIMQVRMPASSVTVMR